MDLSWRIVEVALPAPVGGAGHVATARRGVVVTLSEGGHEGRGEASPLPGYSPETLDDVLRALETGGPPPPSLAFALESARLDVDGQRRGRPAWALLGGAPGRTLGLARVLDGGTPEIVRAQAADAARAGFAAIKLKLDGRALDEGLARATAARRGAPELPLRLDLNRSLPDGEVARLAAFAPLRPAFVEEPCASGALAGPRPPLPLAADESLAYGDLDRALAEGRLAAVVLKPALLGGLARCAALAARAAAAGVPVVVTHLHDGPIARAAAAALALALPGSLPAGLDATPGWPAVSCAIVDGATLVAAPAPGLGLGA